MGRLRRIDCAMPGITRRRWGRGFEYVDEYGERITDEDVPERIRALAIPPGWEDVWICADSVTSRRPAWTHVAASSIATTTTGGRAATGRSSS